MEMYINLIYKPTYFLIFFKINVYEFTIFQIVKISKKYSDQYNDNWRCIRTNAIPWSLLSTGVYFLLF